jgi:hypothetical protein
MKNKKLSDQSKENEKVKLSDLNLEDIQAKFDL